MLQSEEDDSGSDSNGEDASDDNEEDYEYEETYTLTEWFPPDYWRSKLEDARKMSMTMTTQDDTVSVRGEDVDADEYYYNLLKDKIRAAENVVVTDVTVDNSTVTFKVMFLNFYISYCAAACKLYFTYFVYRKCLHWHLSPTRKMKAWKNQNQSRCHTDQHSTWCPAVEKYIRE